jgi:uncharacterized lipoprotein YajG
LHFGKAAEFAPFELPMSNMGNQSKIMKKLICILATAALLGGCEDKTVVTPATGTSPAPDKKVENNTTVVNPTTEKSKETKETTNTTTATSPSSSSSTSTTTTTTTPHP